MLQQSRGREKQVGSAERTRGYSSSLNQRRDGEGPMSPSMDISLLHSIGLESCSGSRIRIQLHSRRSCYTDRSEHRLTQQCLCSLPTMVSLARQSPFSVLRQLLPMVTASGDVQQVEMWRASRRSWTRALRWLGCLILIIPDTKNRRNEAFDMA